jgi:NTP pyrophosphatase (non-canonical NTP hydrolase)
MRKNEFLQDGFDKQLSHVIEECGEVLAAAGKLQRWGWDSCNPLIPEEERETNIDWLKRELRDLKRAIKRFEKTVKEDGL